MFSPRRRYQPSVVARDVAAIRQKLSTLDGQCAADVGFDPMVRIRSLGRLRVCVLACGFGFGVADAEG